MDDAPARLDDPFPQSGESAFTAVLKISLNSHPPRWLDQQIHLSHAVKSRLRGLDR